MYKVSKIEFENKVPNGTQLKLKNNVSYNVSYMDAEKRCLGKLDFRVMDEGMKPFEIKIEMEAVFTYSEEDERADIHTQSFDQIFPFVRHIINSVTSVSGMPGLLIPIMHLEKSKVNVGGPKPDETSPLN